MASISSILSILFDPLLLLERVDIRSKLSAEPIEQSNDFLDPPLLLMLSTSKLLSLEAYLEMKYKSIKIHIHSRYGTADVQS